MITGPRKLRVAVGDAIRAETHDDLVRLAESLTWERGQLKGRRFPDGFIPHLRPARSGTSVDYPWAVEIEEGKGGALALIISPGVVGGIVPKIGDLALDDLDEGGEPPRLIVPDDAWLKRGTGERSLLMLRYQLAHDLSVESVAPVAVAAVPPAADFTWHKLLGFLVRNAGEVRYRPMCFFAQNFDAIAGRTAGRFQPLPRVA